MSFYVYKHNFSFLLRPEYTVAEETTNEWSLNLVPHFSKHTLLRSSFFRSRTENVKPFALFIKRKLETKRAVPNVSWEVQKCWINLGPPPFSLSHRITSNLFLWPICGLGYSSFR